MSPINLPLLLISLVTGHFISNIVPNLDENLLFNVYFEQIPSGDAPKKGYILEGNAPNSSTLL